MVVGGYLKRCPVCGEPIKRAKTAHVIGRVIVEPELEADVYAKCGKGFCTTEQVTRARQKATKLRTSVPRLEEERELKQIGRSLTVSIPRAMVKALDFFREKVRAL